MKLDNILQIFVPKNVKFFVFFEKAAQNALHCAKLMNDLAKTPDLEKRKEIARDIERVEHLGDNITHEIFNALSSNFITPFDREDIHSLASAIDDITDFIHGSAKRIILYKMDNLHPSILQLTDLLIKSTQEVVVGVTQLKSMKNSDAIKEACVKINMIENMADEAYNQGIAKLFEEEKDPIALIKIKEVLEVLEMATDKCEDVSNVIETILVKYS